MKEEVHAAIRGKSIPGGLIGSAKTLRRESALSVLRIARCHVTGAGGAKGTAPEEGLRWGLWPGHKEPQAITEE